MARILIVEDEPVVAMMMSMVLDLAGHHVVGIADDEASAVKQVARSRPDLALVDIKLANNSDGVETALRLKARHPVKVVFVSGHLDSHTQKRAADINPAGYVVKPYSAQRLLKIVSIASAPASAA
jgi:two-component system, response regulator PdtaR